MVNKEVPVAREELYSRRPSLRINLQTILDELVVFSRETLTRFYLRRPVGRNVNGCSSSLLAL